MAVRRLAADQPTTFAFSADNRAWAGREIAKYPEGRAASAVIALLWRVQEQEGWVSEPAIRVVAEMLDMPRIRVLEVATFYTMFQLQPVGRVAHVQVCGTTPCWLRGANDLKDVCRQRIHGDQHALSEDGRFSWEEVECLGACVNAPMIQIGADTFEDLDRGSFEAILDALADGRPVTPGPQTERMRAAPAGGLTSLLEVPEADTATEELPPTGSGDRPAGALDAPRGDADDLKKISGVGPKLEGILNDLGIFHYDQIAGWSPDTVAWVDEHLKFKGRIDREDWIGQAKVLAAGGETDFSRRASADSETD